MPYQRIKNRQVGKGTQRVTELRIT